MDNVEIIRSGYDAFAREDMQTLMAIFDPEIEWNVVTSAGFDSPYRGVDAVLGFFGSLPEVFADLTVTADELVALNEGRVLSLGIVQGHVVEGGAVEIPFAHVWTLRGGRAVRMMEYADAGLLLRARDVVADTASVSG